MVNCPYCNRHMRSTGRIDDPGVEYECTNCCGVWLYVESPNHEILSMKNGVLKGNSIFFPVLFPRVLADIIEQQYDKKQKKRHDNM